MLSVDTQEIKKVYVIEKTQEEKVAEMQKILRYIIMKMSRSEQVVISELFPGFLE